MKPCTCGFNEAVSDGIAVEHHDFQRKTDPIKHKFITDEEWSVQMSSDLPVGPVNPILKTPKTYKCVDTMEDVRKLSEYLNEIAAANEDYRLALDVETYSMDPNLPSDEPSRPIKIPQGWYQGLIKTIQIGIDPILDDTQFIIDVEKIQRPKEIGKLLKNSLENAIVIGQNIKYDYQFMYVHTGIDIKNPRDTMLMGQIEKAGDKMSHNLSSILARYIDPATFYKYTGMTFEEFAEFKKELQKSGWRGKLSELQLRYGALDVRLMFPAYDAICASIDSFIEQFETFNKPGQTLLNTILMECNLIKVYALMELRGVCLDTDHHKGVTMPFLESRMEEANKEVAVWFKHQVKKSNGLRGKKREVWYIDEVINMGSPKQIKEAMLSVGIVLPEKDSTSAETLEKFQFRHPSISWILEYKKASSLLSKFGQKLIDLCMKEEDWQVIHANWFQIGSDDESIDTGRSSCQNPNLQQIPNKDDKQIRKWNKTAAEMFRSSFIARPGNILIDADFSQIEPRIQAEICDEESQIVAFQEAEKTGGKIDLHALTAKAAFGLDFLPTDAAIQRLKKEGELGDKVSATLAVEYKRFRDAGKILNLGIGYGMGVAKLARRITEETGQECTLERARQIISTYYENLPGIRAMKQEVESAARKLAEANGSLKIGLGRKPLYVEQTEDGRKRRFCLKTVGNPSQEDMARNNPEMLARWYNNGRNEYNSRLSEIARQAYNFKVQGTCADILKKALILVQSRFDAIGLDPLKHGIIMVVHDEILAEVPASMVDVCQQIILDSMLEAARTVLKRVPPLVTIAHGQRWDECH